MKASVIISTFSRPVRLKYAIDSVLAQNSKQSFELIIVDDNGVNTPAQIETKLIVESYSNSDIIQKYIVLQENMGACEARNIGAKNADGEFLYFLDDDDQFLPNKLEIQNSFLENNLLVDGCLAALIRMDDSGNEIKSISNLPVVGDFKNFVLNGNFFTPMLCIRKASFLKCGGFINIPRFQDKFFLMNALKADLKFEVINQPLHVMYEHDENRITNVSIQKTRISLCQIRKWLLNYQNEFSKKQWRRILYNQDRQLAVCFYVSQSKLLRLKSSLYFFLIFLRSGNLADLKFTIKAIIK